MYSIQVTTLEGLHETLKQFVKEVNEFAWDMRQSGLGVLMPEEIEIKVTLIDEDAGTSQEVETTTSGGKQTISSTTEQKGRRTDTVHMTDTDTNKITTQRETDIGESETTDETTQDATVATHGDEIIVDDASAVVETTTYGTEVSVEDSSGQTETTTFGTEVETSETVGDTTTSNPGTETAVTVTGVQVSQSSMGGGDGSSTNYEYF